MISIIRNQKNLDNINNFIQFTKNSYEFKRIQNNSDNLLHILNEYLNVIIYNKLFNSVGVNKWKECKKYIKNSNNGKEFERCKFIQKNLQKSKKVK